MRLLRWLRIGFTLLFGGIAYMSQVGPVDALSNLSKWYTVATTSSAPSWLQNPQIDLWWTILFSILAIGSFFWFVWPYRNLQIKWPRKLGGMDRGTERDEAAFNLGFNRVIFERNRARKGAALLRLAQLRSEGVVIRNDASSLTFTADLDTWSRKVDEWMREVVDVISAINPAEAEFFTTIDVVPPARVPIPNLRLGGGTDRESFTLNFRMHDVRLAKLERLLKKLEVGA